MIPVVTNASGEAFFKCYPGSRPNEIGMGTSATVTTELASHFLIYTNSIAAGVTF